MYLQASSQLLHEAGEILKSAFEVLENCGANVGIATCTFQSELLQREVVRLLNDEKHVLRRGGSVYYGAPRRRNVRA